jgi:hypothetical protein
MPLACKRDVGGEEVHDRVVVEELVLRIAGKGEESRGVDELAAFEFLAALAWIGIGVLVYVH